ncbi:putative magnesium transporter [Citrus sinensis]|uniref:Magnesium transporter n=1 Tax=Citrus sinensis TaxID=2711 RepID=A0ACB8K9X4_CITSI|nr:putative magnesium transporter [Citrus sinensis]
MADPNGHSWRDGMSSDNIKGLILALSSSIFIGSSFIVKKKGLKKAGASGVRAGFGGYSYLYEPLWWVGMITMVVGEIANFAAYAFAPAILVTPLGALSIIISAALAHIILRERLHIFGILGCILCVVGSTTIVLHAPAEREIESVIEVWNLATEPAFLLYAALVITAVFILIFHYIPQYGQTHIMVYIGVCSLVGSLSVMSVKAIGIALKLTLSGMNQLIYPQTWAFTLIVIVCVLTQMNYLNMALDTFNTAVVSPIYYVMFTSLTILASVIMFKDWDRQNPTQIVTEMCGFVTILAGTFLLHKTKDLGDGSSLTPSMSLRLSKHADDDDLESEERPNHHWNSRTSSPITFLFALEGQRLKHNELSCYCISHSMTAAIQWPFGTYTNSELKLTMNINRSKNFFFFEGGGGGGKMEENAATQKTPLSCMALCWAVPSLFDHPFFVSPETHVKREIVLVLYF